MHVPTAVAEATEAVKPRLRGWLHLATSPLALAAAIVLVVLATTGPARVAAVAYGITTVLLFAVSASYHRGRWSARANRVLGRVDHANIFLMIAGSYTPFAVLTLRGHIRVAVLTAVWAGAVAGAVARVLWVSAPRWLHVLLYTGLGWGATLVVPQLIRGAGVAAFVLVAAGGLCYTVGGVVYALRRPDPWPRWFGFHEVFHALTVAGYVCQYVAASLVVYRAT